MFLHVTQAKYIADYKILLTFNNGELGEVDLSQEFYGEVFEPLKDIHKFKNFKVDMDTIVWANGADFAPEFLYELMKKRGYRGENP